MKNASRYQKKYGFAKAERLRNKKEIDFLFKQGTTFFHYPFQVFFFIDKNPRQQPLRVLISVPIKKFPLAVERNKIKRVVREAYRLNKIELAESSLLSDYNLTLGWVYVAKKYPDTKKTYDQMKQIINHLLSLKPEEPSHYPSKEHTRR